jgi:hypothetical protein
VPAVKTSADSIDRNLWRDSNSDVEGGNRSAKNQSIYGSDPLLVPHGSSLHNVGEPL